MTSAYAVEFQPRNYRVWAEKKDPETGEIERIPFRKQEFIFCLTHSSGDEVRFKYHLHQGKWLWGDSRRPGSISLDDVLTEIARMIFHGSVEAAGLFVKGCFEAQGL